MLKRGIGSCDLVESITQNNKTLEIQNISSANNLAIFLYSSIGRMNVGVDYGKQLVKLKSVELKAV